eukprot:9857594-Karenia_brevis.AAC.1
MISFSAAISACENGGHWKRLSPLFDDMRSKGLSSTMISFKAAISPRDELGQRQHVALLDEMRSKGLSPNMISFK